MKDDEVSAILTKTNDYFHFIKNSLAKESIVVTDKDSEILKTIESYLKMLGDNSSDWRKLKTEEHQGVLSKCFVCLQRLDRIAKDYGLFRNGSVH